MEKPRGQTAQKLQTVGTSTLAVAAGTEQMKFLESKWLSYLTEVRVKEEMVDLPQTCWDPSVSPLLLSSQFPPEPPTCEATQNPEVSCEQCRASVNKSESKQVIYLSNMHMKMKLMHIRKRKKVIKVVASGLCK